MDLSSNAGMIAQINQFGNFAPLAAFSLFVLQAVLPVFPYIVLTAAAGMLFGLKLGFLLAWSGALSGACLAYWLCRLAGNTAFIQRYCNLLGYDKHNLTQTTAFWTIVLARIFPVIPTPLINIGAALGGVSFPIFLSSSALGKLPTAALYSGLGLALFNIRDLNTALLVLGLVLLVLLLLRHQAKKFFAG